MTRGLGDVSASAAIVVGWLGFVSSSDSSPKLALGQAGERVLTSEELLAPSRRPATMYHSTQSLELTLDRSGASRRPDLVRSSIILPPDFQSIRRSQVLPGPNTAIAKLRMPVGSAISGRQSSHPKVWPLPSKLAACQRTRPDIRSAAIQRRQHGAN